MIRARTEPFLGGFQHGVTRRCRTAVDRVDQHQFFFHPNGAQRHRSSLRHRCYAFVLQVDG